MRTCHRRAVSLAIRYLSCLAEFNRSSLDTMRLEDQRYVKQSVDAARWRLGPAIDSVADYWQLRVPYRR